ncbi:MAG: AMP-binding protein [Steroidobacteraceae bacterium]
MNLAVHLRRAAGAYAERPAIALGAAVVHRYGELAERVARLAAALRHRFALQPGARVALVMRNCPEYLEILYACWHAGLIAVPVNAKLHPAELAWILADSGAELAFVSPALATAVTLSASPRGVIEAGAAEYRQLLQQAPLPLHECGADEDAWLFYTSGTTGKPKGARLSHGNLRAMSLCYFADVDPQPPWRALLHAAPMSHGSGLYALAHVMKASCHVIPEADGFDAAEVFALIRAWPGTVLFAAPTMVRRLLDHREDAPERQLKAILYGGGPMYLEDLLAALARFGPKLAQLYGQGETPMTITALSADIIADRAHPRWRQRAGSVGVAQSLVEVRTVDESDAPVRCDEVGEVVVRGATVMRGYWNNPAASAETLRDGWLHTGDLGSFDADGFLTLKDRSRDVIISGGSNIYPREVEEVLLQHPDIVEVSVIGRPDRDWGESVVAYVVTRGEVVPDRESLDQLCAQCIARFKRPRHYRFVDALPKNSYGKVLKKALRHLEQSRAD